MKPLKAFRNPASDITTQHLKMRFSESAFFVPDEYFVHRYNLPRMGYSKSVRYLPCGFAVEMLYRWTQKHAHKMLWDVVFLENICYICVSKD